MKKSSLSLALLFTLLGISQIFAQSDLQIFGFFSAQLMKQSGEFTLKAPIGPGGKDVILDQESPNFLGSDIQQLNLFFRKELSSSFTVWVNFEATNSFSSMSTSKSNIEHGKFSLEEAWVNYEYNDLFKVKVGMLIPRFTYMNEIKNRTPLLPYSVRPLIYETALAGTISPAPYLPEKAFVQIYGNLPTGDVSLNYALFVGNSEKSYWSQGVGGGMDTVNFKAIGGRVGLNFGDLRVGGFFSTDKANRKLLFGEDVPRTRFGFDLGYAFKGFFVEGEYISVSLSSKKVTTDMNKSFYFGTLGYNISEALYVYGMLSNVTDKEVNYLAGGLTGYSTGVGFRPDNGIVIKAEYARYYLPDNTKFNVTMGPGMVIPASVFLDYKNLSISVSVLF